MNDMYMEQILDHYKNPHNKGKIKKPQICNREKNPSCGDEIEVSAKITKGIVTEVKFDGQGCAISQAAISLVTDFVKGKKIEEILKLTKKDVLNLLGIDVAPLRVKCAMLGLRVLQRGLLKYVGKNEKSILLSDIDG